MTVKKILEFIHFSEKLKDELRHNWTAKDRQESVAEHTWMMSIMAILLAEKLEANVDISKVMKMVAIHDIAELGAGDVPAFMEKEKVEQEKIEAQFMKNLKSKYPELADEIIALWNEYNKLKTNEAKFVKALDKLEVRLQHNSSKISRWNDIEYPRSQYVAEKYCNYEPVLKEFNELIKKESRNKILKESNKKLSKVLKDAKKLKEP